MGSCKVKRHYAAAYVLVVIVAFLATGTPLEYPTTQRFAEGCLIVSPPKVLTRSNIRSSDRRVADFTLIGNLTVAFSKDGDSDEDDGTGGAWPVGNSKENFDSVHHGYDRGGGADSIICSMGKP